MTTYSQPGNLFRMLKPDEQQRLSRTPLVRSEKPRRSARIVYRATARRLDPGIRRGCSQSIAATSNTRGSRRRLFSRSRWLNSSGPSSGLTIWCTVVGHGASPLAPRQSVPQLLVIDFCGRAYSGGTQSAYLGVWLLVKTSQYRNGAVAGIPYGRE